MKDVCGCETCAHIDNDKMCSECAFDSKWEQKPMTNADRIRAMTNDELADFLCNNTKCECCQFGCWTGCLVREWLKQPVGVDHDTD